MSRKKNTAQGTPSLTGKFFIQNAILPVLLLALFSMFSFLTVQSDLVANPVSLSNMGTAINIANDSGTTDGTILNGTATNNTASNNISTDHLPEDTTSNTATIKMAKKKAKKKTTITISAAGDCTFGSDQASPSSVNFYAVYQKQNDPSYFFKKVKKIFENDDMTLVNFEGTLTTRTTRAPKTYAFKGNPSYVRILKKGSIESVAFANNHCRDYGEGSYTDTIKCFNKAGITYSSYSKVGIYKTKGKKIGMISVNGLEDTTSVKKLIHDGMKKLNKKKADIKIVSMHAGIEYDYTPTETQRAIAKYAVQQGADLVLGHHPHIIQGIERYKGSYIVYSLGNFCFGGNTNPRDKDTMIFQQKFVFVGNKLKKKQSTAKVIPCCLSSASGINNYQPTLVSGANKTRILKKMDSMCRPLGQTFKKKKGKITTALRSRS